MSDTIPIPNIIIAGAPKCGTSSLYDWLCQHPLIEGSNPKEPFILMDKDNPLYNKKADFENNGWACYEPYFLENDAHYYLEASTHYIYQEGIVDKLLSLPEPPKVIFALRNPVERIFSSFHYSVNNLASIKSNISFDQYVESILNEEPLNFGDNPSGYVLKRDLKYGNYNYYLSKWFTHYPKERIKIVLFDDIKQNSVDVLKDIFGFLELDYNLNDFRFDVKNETRTIKFKPLHRMLHSLNKRTSNFKINKWAKQYYFKIQKAGNTQKASDKAILRLKNYYKESVENLEKLTSLNLKSWK